MRLLAALLLTIWLPTARAAADPVVVELYTSQGCSSCPPADALLSDLAKVEDILPLALHVDYWDYLGWRDSFADPRYTKRQRSYARAAGKRTVYTPQMIIGGVEHVVGNRPKQVIRAIAMKSSIVDPVQVEVERNGPAVLIRLQPANGPVAPSVVQIVRYMDYRDVRIQRGENAGRTIRYSNIVTDWQVVERWNGRRTVEVALTLEGDDDAAVIVQEVGFGPILAAARLR